MIRAFDLNGNHIRTTRSVRRLDAEFLDGALPAWLTAPDGTAVATGLGVTGRPGLQVTTAGNTGDRATIQGPGIDWRHAHAIHFTAEGLGLSNDADNKLRLELAVSGVTTTKTGAMLFEDAAQANGTLRTYRQASTDVDTLVPAKIRSKASRNWGLTLYPRSGEVAVTEDDQEVFWSQPSTPWGWVNGSTYDLVVPRISIQALDANAYNFTLLAFRVRIDMN